MSYTTDDFKESISRVAISPDDVAAVVSAWGAGDGMGDGGAGYKWSEDGVTDWSGGFLLRLKDGSYAYVTGWVRLHRMGMPGRRVRLPIQGSPDPRPDQRRRQGR